MSIFNNISNFTPTDESRLLVKLKYGEPSSQDEWFEQLPSSIVDLAYELLEKKQTVYREDTHIKQQILSIMLRQPANKESATKALSEALARYHTLYP